MIQNTHVKHYIWDVRNPLKIVDGMIFCFHFFVIVYCNSLLELYVGKVLSKLKRVYFYKILQLKLTQLHTYIVERMHVPKIGKKDFE